MSDKPQEDLSKYAALGIPAEEVKNLTSDARRNLDSLLRLREKIGHERFVELIDQMKSKLESPQGAGYRIDKRKNN